MATGTTNIGFEEKLWQAADKLRSNMDAAEYKHVVLSILTGKYRMELNLLAHIYENNMSVTSQPVSKPAEILWNELRYINQHIPLFALERKGISDYLNQKMGF